MTAGIRNTMTNRKTPYACLPVSGFQFSMQNLSSVKWSNCKTSSSLTISSGPIANPDRSQMKAMPTYALLGVMIERVVSRAAIDRQRAILSADSVWIVTQTATPTKN